MHSRICARQVGYTLRFATISSFIIVMTVIHLMIIIAHVMFVIRKSICFFCCVTGKSCGAGSKKSF